jgi:hypothetical protein
MEDEVEGRVRASQLKHYLLTHSTPQSQARESLEEFIDRDNRTRQDTAIKRVYLDSTPRKKRSEADFKKFVARHQHVTKMPSIMLRELITRKINDIEKDKEIKYGDRNTPDGEGLPMDKLYLIRSIFNDIVNDYRAANEFDEDKKTKQSDYLLMCVEEEGKDYAQIYEDYLDAFPQRRAPKKVVGEIKYLPSQTITLSPQKRRLSQSGSLSPTYSSGLLSHGGLAHTVSKEEWEEYQRQKKKIKKDDE